MEFSQEKKGKSSHLGLMEVEKVMEKMEGIQPKPPPDVLLPVFPQNSAWHFPNDESNVEVGPRTPSSSLESPKEKVFGAGEAGQARTQQQGVSKSFPSLSNLDKQTCWESKLLWQ